MSSAFVFNRFRLVSLSYKKGDDGSKEQKLRFLPSIQRGLEAKNEFKYNLNLQLEGAVHLDLAIEGFFTSNNSIPEEEIESAFLQIGFSVLFPYVRSIVSSITSLDGGKALTLPLLNVSDLFNGSRVSSD